MASAQQLIGLIKSHAEGDSDRFFDLAMQLSAAEEQKGHKRLAEQLRQWAEAGQTAPSARIPSPTPIAAPRGDLAQFLAASYPSRSEEHTSELQSLMRISYAVFCLKKKKKHLSIKIN